MHKRRNAPRINTSVEAEGTRGGKWGRLSCHAVTMTCGALELGWPLGFVPHWRKKAKPLYLHIDQSLAMDCPGRDFDLGQGSFLQPRARVEMRGRTQLRAVSYQ